MSSPSTVTSQFLPTLFALSLMSVAVYSASAQSADDDHGDRRSERILFVVNSPSSVSAGGTDSVVTFDARGHSTVFFSAKHNLTGLRDIACDPRHPRHIFVPRSVAPATAGMLVIDRSGHEDSIPTLGNPFALAFDKAGNLYTAMFTSDFVSGVIIKNDTIFTNLPYSGIGQLAVDSSGNLYLTDPDVSPRIFRIDQAGNVTVHADASKGLISPYGLAIDSRNNLFVANNPPSSAASILKIDPSGNVTSFATNISFQPIITSMAFDDDDNLYATLREDSTILRFDRRGNMSVFASASDGAHNPVAITAGACPVDRNDREEQRQ